MHEAKFIIMDSSSIHSLNFVFLLVSPIHPGRIRRNRDSLSNSYLLPIAYKIGSEPPFPLAGII